MERVNPVKFEQSKKEILNEITALEYQIQMLRKRKLYLETIIQQNDNMVEVE